MARVITAPPDKRTVYPWDESEPLLSWYEGAYDAAFIALHPFRNVLGVAPLAKALLERVGWMPIPGNPYEVMIELYRYGRSNVAAWPEIVRLEIQYASPVSWESVRAGAGFSDLAALNHALLSGIGALRPEYADQAGWKQLDSYCERQGLFEPSEGSFQHLMQHGIADLFAKAGLQQIEACKEFGEEIRTLQVASLREMQGWREPEIVERGSLYAPDRSLLVTVHWDSHFTLVCGTRFCLAAADPAAFFEGFWCTSATSHHWWKQRAGYCGAGR
jgi:hypothetical protein